MMSGERSARPGRRTMMSTRGALRSARNLLLFVAATAASLVLDAGHANAAGDITAVSVGAQSGTLTANSAGSATFAVSATRGSNGSLTVTFDPPVFAGGTPAGVSSQFTGGANNASVHVT